MKYFDSHAHYYDERFAEELDSPVENLISELFAENVSFIVNVATSPENALLAIEQAKKFEGMYTAIGIHPSDTRFQSMYTAIGIHPSDTRFLSNIDEEISEIERMILCPKNRCAILKHR